MRQTSRWAHAAIWATWFVNGFVTFGLGARNAEIAENLGLGELQFGLVLVGQALGMTLVMFSAAPRLVDRFGGRRMAIAAGLIYTASFALVGAAQVAVALFAVLLLIGVANAAYDLAIQSMASDAERRSGRTLMSKFELGFLIGGIVGVAIGGLAAGRVSVSAHLAAIAAAGVVLLLTTWRFLPAPFGPDTGDDDDEGNGARRSGPKSRLGFTAATARLALVAVGALWIEGTIVDWGTILYKDALQVPATQYAIGLIAFVVASVVALLAGDRLAARLGHRRVVVVGAVAVVGGALMVAFGLGSLAVATVGLALVGVGVANAHPFAVSAAGHVDGSRGLSRVGGASYLGLAFAKWITGGLAAATSIRTAVVVTLVCWAVAIATASREVGATTHGGPAERD